MKLIPLSKGKFAKVDDEDCDYLMQWKWFYNGGYAERLIYRRGKTNLHIRMQNQIMKPKKGLLVDHIDLDSLNNQKSNLRVATYSQNRINCKKQSGTYSSRYKGVSYDNREKKWVAQIVKKG